MNFPDLFRSFFGLNRQDPRSSSGGVRDDFRNPIWNVDDDDDTDDELHHNFGRQNTNIFPGESFSIFTDPLEMARYAEHQMERMMSLFSSMMENDFQLPSNIPAMPPGFSFPAIKDKEEGSIRDEYLKPGYSKPCVPDKVDTDLDNEIKNLDSLLENIEKIQVDESKSRLDKYTPGMRSPGSGNMFFKQVIIRSVTRPDGSVETIRTVRNGDGTEETTSTITQGDGSNALREYNLDERNPAIPFPRGFWSNFFGF